MDTNILAALIGVGGAGALSILAWFCRRFLRWPFGEAEMGEDGVTPAEARHHLGPIVRRIGRVETEIVGVKGDILAVRREREEGERRILDKIDDLGEAIRDHAIASANSISDVREDIGHLTGRFDEFSGGHRRERGPRRPVPPTRHK